MSPASRSLLDLRGHFADPDLPEHDLPKGSTIYSFGYAFPLSDELAVLVFNTGALLVNARTRKIFWSILCCLTGAAFNPARNVLALANGQKLYLWDLTTGHLEHTWSAESAVTQLTFSPDGSFLATALWDTTDVVLWNTADGQRVRDFQQDDFPYGCNKSIALSPDGHLLAMGNCEDHQIWLWDTSTAQLVHRMETHPEAQRINGLAFSPDGSLLVGGEFAGGNVPFMHVWDVRTGQLQQPFPAKSWLPTFHPAGHLLASVSSDPQRKIDHPRDIVFWDVANRTALQTCQHAQGRPHHLAFSPGGSTLVTCGDDRAVHCWNVADGQELYRIEPRFSIRSGAAFSADASLLVTSTWDGAFRLWDTQNGQLLRNFGIPSLRDEGIAMSADAERFLSWSQHAIGAGSLHIWQPAVGERRNLGGTQGWVYRAILSANGKSVAAICGDAKIRIWSLDERPQDPRQPYTQPIETLGFITPAHAPLAFSPDGRFLASVGEDQHIHIWKMQTHAHLYTLEGKQQEVTSLAWSARGHFLAVGSVEGSIHVWKISERRVHRVYQGMKGRPLNLAFDAHEERLGAVSRDGEVRIWPINTALSRIDEAKEVTERAWALDGSALPPGSQEEKISLWRLSPTGTKHTLALANTQILSLAFRLDGSLLVAGYESGQTRVWRLEQVER